MANPGHFTMSTVAQISIEQYDRMIASGVFDGPNRRRFELIHGELRMMSPIGPSHEDTVDILDEWSHDVAPRHKVRIRIQNSIRLIKFLTVPEPDVAWVRRQSYRKARPAAKDVFLLIEVSESSLDYDRGEKAELYAAAGIKDYWVVNLIDRCVETFRDPQRGLYRRLQTYQIGDEVHPLAFPMITLAVASLFSV